MRTPFNIYGKHIAQEVDNRDVLATDLKHVVADCPLRGVRETIDGVFFDMTLFHRHIEKTYDELDICSFGISDECINLPVRRAVIGLGGRVTPTFRSKPQHVQYFTNVHSKIIIGYTKAYPNFYDVYVGSHNFVGGGLHELMLHVRDEQQKRAIKNHYESYWLNKNKKK